MTCFERKRAIQLFCLLVFCYSFVHQRADWNDRFREGWNQTSRLNLLHALFVHQTFRIDAYHTNTGDKSVHDGHYYSDKAPGTVFLALPAFALSTAILKIVDIPLDSPRGWLVSSWISTGGFGWLGDSFGNGRPVFASLPLCKSGTRFCHHTGCLAGSRPVSIRNHVVFARCRHGADLHRALLDCG